MLKLTTNDIEGKTPEITQSLDELAREGTRFPREPVEISQIWGSQAFKAAGIYLEYLPQVVTTEKSV